MIKRLLVASWLVAGGMVSFGLAQDDPFLVGEGAAAPPTASSRPTPGVTFDDPFQVDSDSNGTFVTHPERLGATTTSQAGWFSALRDSWEADPIAAESWAWHLLPEGLMYKSYIAGEKEPRMSTAFLQERNGELLWDSSLGARVGIVRFGTGRGIQPEGFQMDVEAAALLRMQPQEERDVMATDFRAGVPFTYREGPFQAKFGYYHISSHAGDEYMLKNPDFKRNNYSRDALILGLGYFPIDPLRLYAEVGWSFFGTGGNRPWEFQTGLEWSENGPTGLRGAPFFAANLYLRETVDWQPSFNMWAGWQWRGSTSDHTFRAGLQYYTGPNSQYIFLRDHEDLLGFGIRYDF